MIGLVKRIQNRILYKSVMQLVQPYTLVGPERILNLCRLARRIESDAIPGDLIECGVCNGGTAAIMAHYASRSRLKRTVWLLDSFQGMPAITVEDGPSIDGIPAGDYIGKERGDMTRVKEVLRLVGADMNRVRIVPGWFQDTFPSISGSISQIALLNIDADWYESVKLCLETFYDRVLPGGFISFDDYGHWPGCKKAVDEFVERRQLPYKLRQVDYTARWFRKE